ncbi:MAG: FAD-dependent oxidoreductase [Actinomycetia bacterium]|nr:FAD-dependent oxidoreductase [Actinomycetes bacterium]
MTSRDVAVLGAGPADMFAALALARHGHQVTLIERDELSKTPAEDAPTWSRSGVPHFGQPHAFILHGRAGLKEHFSDVYRDLIDAGAVDVDARPKRPGTVVPEDEELQYLAVRRPVIE